MSGLDIPLEGKSIRQLCGIVLVFEAIVIGLAIPVAIVLEHANHGLAGGVGGALAVCAILISGVVGRPRMGWALVAGTILQLLVIAFGVVVPAMYVPRRDLRRALGHRHLASPPRHPPPRRLLTPPRPTRPFPSARPLSDVALPPASLRSRTSPRCAPDIVLGRKSDFTHRPYQAL
jgi:hypothetical protein